MKPVDHLNTAIRDAGGIKPFCAALGVTHQAVYSWKKRGWVPIERAVQIERKFGVFTDYLIKPSTREALASLNPA
jgi:hypothetical protein